MAKTEFFIAMIPPTTTFQDKKITIKNNKAMIYSSPELKAVRVKLTAHLAKHVPEQKYTGAVQLVTKWLFPRTGGHRDGEPKTTRPDLDNLTKLFLDCCTELGYWNDDATITSLIVEKFWSAVPGIYVKIEPLGEISEV